MPPRFDEDLLTYFTGVEYLRHLFQEYIRAQIPPKHIIAIHGVSGVGKSALLRIYRLRCHEAGIPVALASGDEAKSALEVLVSWRDGLQTASVHFSSFNKALEHYREVQAKVDEHAIKAKETGGRMMDLAGKAASKTAEAAGGALAGAAIGSAIPGIGTTIGAVLGGALGGFGTEVLVDWLRGFLPKSDIDMLLDPGKALTEKFLDDVSRAADKQRIVLLLDTYEQMTALDDWVRNVAQRLHRNTLLVIAGHAPPNWSRDWQSWLAHTHVEELEPMDEEMMRALVQRYYATIRGGQPDAAQVEEIVRFARGLPLAATSAVNLWVEYGIEDFRTVKPRVFVDLVDRIMEGVPSTLIPALEAAAVVRWFDQPILRAVNKVEDVRDVYRELRRFPFIRTRAEGLVLHDAMREIIDENLRVQDSERHYDLHTRAGIYFENRLRGVTGEEAQRLGLERLYHLFRADEEVGVLLFQELAEELARHLFVGRLATLINDVNSYLLHGNNSRFWRDYYNARLLHISVHFSDAEKIYVRISENKLAEPKLKAYALCDLGQIWTRNYRLSEPGGLARAFSAIERSRKLVPELDPKLARNFSNLRYAFMFEGELDKAMNALRQQYDYYKSVGDRHGIAYSLDLQKDLYGLLGNWSMATDAEKEGLEILDSMPSNPYFRARLEGHNIWHKIWSGRYAEAERGIRQALTLAEDEEQIEGFPGLYRDLGLVIGLQRRWESSHEYFAMAAGLYKARDYLSTGLGSTLGQWGLIALMQKDFRKADEYLTSSFSIKTELQDNNGIPEVLVWTGQLYETLAWEAEHEVREDYLSQAESYYQQCLDYVWTSRRYYECTALTGLAFVKFFTDEYTDIADLFEQAERIAEEYRYHDLMAFLNLCKGHIQWSATNGAWPGGFEAAMLSYKRALLHALSFNHILLDEVVWGDQNSTRLDNIISRCSLQGSDGRRMVDLLVNWWKSDADDLAAETLDNDLLTELEDGSLAQAENLVRRRMPGGAAPQRSLTEVFNRFLEPEV